MSAVKSYQDLLAWQRAMDLAVICDAIVHAPAQRSRGPLRNQLLRAAISVPANIAEGAGRSTRPDYLRHLSIASGSLAEIETHLMLVERVGLERSERVSAALSIADEVGRLLTGLDKSLRRGETKG